MLSLFTWNQFSDHDEREGGFIDDGLFVAPPPYFKLVLLGTDRTQPFEQFATTEAIQMTEIFEYSQKLSNPDFVQPSFLYYKFLYAIRLLDFGFASQALHYLEELAKAVTKHPQDLDPDLAKVMNQVYK